MYRMHRRFRLLVVTSRRFDPSSFRALSKQLTICGRLRCNIIVDLFSCVFNIYRYPFLLNREKI